MVCLLGILLILLVFDFACSWFALLFLFVFIVFAVCGYFMLLLYLFMFVLVVTRVGGCGTTVCLRYLILTLDLCFLFWWLLFCLTSFVFAAGYLFVLFCGCAA